MQNQNTIPEGVNGHYDCLTLAREQLGWCGALLEAIHTELETKSPNALQLKELSSLGRYLAMDFEAEFDRQAQLLDEHEKKLMGVKS